MIQPAGIVSTGWPAVRDTCAGFGVVFDPWQDGAGRLIMAKRADGTYAASIGGVAISIPRQVGKTFLLGAIVFALCLLQPGLTVIWTAHRVRTANETFSSMQGFAKRKKVRPHVAKVVLGSGDEAIEFVNGSRVLFGARERGFGRGFPKVGVLVFDEAQILTENAIDDMVPATNQAENPLLLFTGTPPKPTDPGEVFARKRAEALSGESDDSVYIEFSADRGCDPMDRKQWAKANASYPKRTNEASILRMKKNLTDESFVREALGIWDEDGETGALAGWDALADVESRIESNRQWALVVEPLDPERPRKVRWASIGVAGRRADGRPHVEWMEHRPIVQRDGTEWIIETVVAGWEAKRIPIRIRPGAPEGAYIDQLVELGVEVVEVSGVDMTQATEQIINATTAGTLAHLGQSSLDKAARVAVLRTVGDSTTWAQRPRKRGQTLVEITPLVAVTVALGGVPAEQPVDLLANIH